MKYQQLKVILHCFRKATVSAWFSWFLLMIAGFLSK
jgi:hypothetical protein